MQSSLDTEVRILNKLFNLSSYAMRFSKPYQISRIKKLYLEYSSELEKKYGILKFDSKTYREVFDQNNQISEILEKKASAIESGDYELAASLRDDEKRIAGMLLTSMGVNSEDRFFHYDGRIYEIG